MILSASSRAELNWWIFIYLLNYLFFHTNIFLMMNPNFTFKLMPRPMAGEVWGENKRTGGRWNQQEASHHINYQELPAVLLTIKALCEKCANLHIRVQCDNTTAVCYINNMGGSKSPDCNSVARQIWDYCVERNIWISASHLPGCENTEADRELRQFNDHTEWQLQSDIYYSISKRFGQPSIDLFASPLIKQCPVYASWRHDPDVMFVDAFSANWNNFFFYAFPPFSLIGKCLEKNSSKESRGDSSGALLDLPKLVSQIAETTSSSSIDDHSQGNPPDSSRVSETSPFGEKAQSVSLSFYAETLQEQRPFWESNQHCSPILAPIIAETVWCPHQKMASLLY